MRGASQLLNVIPYTLYGKYIFRRPAWQRAARHAPARSCCAPMMGSLRSSAIGRIVSLRIIASDGTEFDRAKLRDLMDGVSFKKYRSVFTFSIARLAHFARGEDNATLGKDG